MYLLFSIGIADDLWYNLLNLKSGGIPYERNLEHIEDPAQRAGIY